MCMGTLYSKKKQDKIRKAAQRRGYITVYKVAWKKRKWSYPPFYSEYGAYKKGIQKARSLYHREGGWHGFLDLRSAKKYVSSIDIILVCKAKASWIKDCGHSRGKKTILLTHLCFPKFPDTKVTVKEFKEQYKKWKKNGGN